MPETDVAALAVDDRIWFTDEARPYTIQAITPDGRWVIATKPFAARHTVLYTVIDRANGVRGRDNYGGLGYETRGECQESAAKFADGSARHSGRHKPISYTMLRVEHAAVPDAN